MSTMSVADVKESLDGVLAFSPTPFTAAGELDAARLGEHVTWLASSGASAVVICGGVGEFYALSQDEVVACAAVAAEAAAGRIPVLLGVGHSTRIAASIAAQSAAVGIDGLMINPFYFVEPSIKGAVTHYESIADSAGLGMVIYNTKALSYTTQDIVRISEIPEVIGLKDETGDLEAFEGYANTLGDRLRWINGMAEQYCLAYVERGATAMTSGLFNLVPEFTNQVWEAARAQDGAAFSELIDKRASRLLAFRRAHSRNQTSIIKEGMALLGRPVGPVRQPLLPLNQAELAELVDAMREADFLTDPVAEAKV